MATSKPRTIRTAHRPTRPHAPEMPRRTVLSRSISAALLATSVAGPASAQVEEIIVTATKRSESVQDVPLSISAFSGDFTREVNLDDVKDLVMFTPGVTGNSKDSFIDVISIRGIRTNDFGNGGDPSAGFFKNNLYEGRNGAVVTSLYDMQRSEVLRGPQGFLFGRNAIGGAFSMHTRRPVIGGGRDGYVELDVGERGHAVAEGGATFGVSDNFAIRLAGYYSTEDGYVDNLAKPDNDRLIEHEKGALRLSGQYAKDALTVNATIEYEERNQSGTVYRATGLGASWEALVDIFGVTIGGDGRDIDSELLLGSADDADILTLGLQIDYDLGWATLTSTTGYKDHDYFYAEDFDGSVLPGNNYAQDQTGDYFQTELRLVSNDDGPLSWYAGASYYHEDIDTLFTQAGGEEFMCDYYLSYYGFDGCADYFAYYGYVFTPTPSGNLVERNQVRGKFQGWAAYVDLTYAFNPRFDLGVGLRYTYDEKDFGINALPIESELGPFFALGFTTVGFLEDKKDWDDFTPRIIARYRPTDDTLIYASATRGYKSGGFGSFAVAPTIPFGSGIDLTPADGFRPAPFDPETVWSYELGYKDTVFDGRANVSLAAFYYEYEDLQVTFTGEGGGIKVDNVARAEGVGLEGALNATLSEHWDLYLSAALFDSETTGLEQLCDLPDPLGCEGSHIWWAPKFSGAAVLKAHYPFGAGEIRGALEAVWESKRGGGFEGLPDSRIGAYEDLTLRIGYHSPANWSVTGYVENLTDKLYYDGSANNGGLLPAFVFGPSRPRTFGVRLGYTFD